MADKSLGHVTFSGVWEFIHGPDGTLYRAPRSNPLDLEGYRQGARFECAPRGDGHRMFLREVHNILLPDSNPTLSE